MASSDGAGLSIRAVTDADAEAIAAFFAATHALDPMVGAISADEWRRFAAAPQNLAGRDFRVALVGGEIAGVATPSLRAHESEAICHFRIVVAPALRRRGVASAVLRHIAEMQAPTPLLLQSLCPERWEAMAGFLEARGFTVIEHELEMLCEEAGLYEPRHRHDVAVRARDDKAALAEALADIHNRAYAGTASFVHQSADSMAAVLAPAVVLVAERRGLPLGFCQLEPAGNATGIENIAVDPHEQGRGIGTLLLQHALAEAARRAGPRVRLSVSDRNAAAYVLYRRYGFAVIAKAARYRATREAVLARIAH